MKTSSTHSAVGATRSRGRTLVRLTATAGLSAGLSLAAAALFVFPAAADASVDSHHGRHSAVFVQTDGVTGNAVVAYERNDNGTLTPAGTYPTGGLGGALTGAVADFLASQDSLTYDVDSRSLYAVNAGSNTITAFDVRGDRLSNRQTISSGGNFPVSIAVHDKLVYVLNARDGGSIQGFRLVGDRLVSVPNWHAALGLSTADVPEFTHTPGQIAFSPDGSQLIVTTKAGSHQLLVFSVGSRGALGSTPAVTTLPGAVPFAVAFDNRGRLAVAEAGPNAVELFDLKRNGTVKSVTSALTGQAATCWVVASGRFLYASNSGSGNVSTFRVRQDTLTDLGTVATDPGTVDATVSSDGDFLYVQTGRNGIVDEFSIDRDGTLTAIGSVTVPGSAGGEGIVAT